MAGLEEVNISEEEMETLRLRYIKKLDQHESAKKMGISQSQYQRDITKAFKKITRALIEGLAIKIEKGDAEINFLQGRTRQDDDDEKQRIANEMN